MGRTFIVSIPDDADIAEKEGAVVFPPGTRVSEACEPGSIDEQVLAVSRGVLLGAESPSETFAASAPRHVIEAVRERARGRGAFSRFVTRAITNQLVDEHRRDVLAAMVAEGAEIDTDLSARLQTLFTRAK